MKICPDCGGEDLEADVSERTSYLHGDTNSYVCQLCGYTGLVPEKSSNNSSSEYTDDDQYYLLPLVTIILAAFLLISLLFQLV